MGEIDRIAEILYAYPQDPRYLLAILLDIQEKERYLPAEAMRRVACYLGVSDARVFAVATFYGTLSLEKKGRKAIRVCMGTACHLRGSLSVLEELEKRLGVKNKGSTEDGEYSLETVNCVGACALAPVVVSEEKTYGRMTIGKVSELFTKEALI